ncbi:MAG: hypothetical protein G01um101425_286 [Candidatus Peregrinibacteria bacterium Gr01-1014_25]|nr:MAG: hypothetical protein G01um101425_286 [Candidatus Peregrinibacteria bacterium Gr01-1014_25]
MEKNTDLPSREKCPTPPASASGVGRPSNTEASFFGSSTPSSGLALASSSKCGDAAGAQNVWTCGFLLGQLPDVRGGCFRSSKAGLCPCGGNGKIKKRSAFIQGVRPEEELLGPQSALSSYVPRGTTGTRAFAAGRPPEGRRRPNDGDHEDHLCLAINHPLFQSTFGLHGAMPRLRCLAASPTELLSNPWQTQVVSGHAVVARNGRCFDESPLRP